jgi:hypothetical protein
MRTNRRIALLVLFGLVASPLARADTLPVGAQPVAGLFEWQSPITLAPLPITIPEGWVFVLTDIETAGGILIHSASDIDHPRWRSVTTRSSFQTGLVFEEAALISNNGSQGGWLSFSGYLKMAQ